VSPRPEIEEVADDRPGYRRFIATYSGRRFSVLWCPSHDVGERGHTLVRALDGDALWSESSILRVDGHVSALACVDFIARAYTMAQTAGEIGYEKRAAEIRGALGIR